MIKHVGKLIVITGPSCSGQTTVTKTLIETDKNFKRLVTCTSRAPRTHEKNGVAYHFITRDNFEAGVKKGNFFEWATVHGDYYGSRLSDYQKLKSAGHDVVLNIDPQGAETVKVLVPDAIIVFLTAPLDVLKMRMMRRASETWESMKVRLSTAEKVLKKTSLADLVVENKEGHLPETVIAINQFLHTKYPLHHKH